MNPSPVPIPASCRTRDGQGWPLLLTISLVLAGVGGSPGSLPLQKPPKLLVGVGGAATSTSGRNRAECICRASAAERAV